MHNWKAGASMRKIVALSLALLVAGCTTPYQEISSNGGVSAYRMSDDTFRISVRGNGYTDDATAIDYTLLKAAETTVANGGRYFAVLNIADASSSQTVYNPGGVVYGYGYAAYLPATVDNIYKPGGDVLIRIFATRPTIPDKVIDAAEIIRNIGPRVKRPEGACVGGKCGDTHSVPAPWPPLPGQPHS